jgi:hypothetical protein
MYEAGERVQGRLPGVIDNPNIENMINTSSVPSRSPSQQSQPHRKARPPMPSKSWQQLLDDAGDTGYEPLPEADYDFVVEKAEAKRASTGKDMFVCTFKIENGAYNNRRVWHNFVVNPDNPNAMAIFFRNMNVLGLNAEYFRQGPSDAHVAEALRNRRFRGHVKQRQWNGETKNEVDRFFTAGGLTAGTPVNPAASLPAGLSASGPAAPAPLRLRLRLPSGRGRTSGSGSGR